MIDGPGARTATAPQGIDPSSRVWPEDLSASGLPCRSALRRLHARVLREAGYQTLHDARRKLRGGLDPGGIAT